MKRLIAMVMMAMFVLTNNGTSFALRNQDPYETQVAKAVGGDIRGGKIVQAPAVGKAESSAVGLSSILIFYSDDMSGLILKKFADEYGIRKVEAVKITSLDQAREFLDENGVFRGTFDAVVIPYFILGQKTTTEIIGPFLANHINPPGRARTIPVLVITPGSTAWQVGVTPGGFDEAGGHTLGVAGTFLNNDLQEVMDARQIVDVMAYPFSQETVNKMFDKLSATATPAPAAGIINEAQTDIIAEELYNIFNEHGDALHNVWLNPDGTYSYRLRNVEPWVPVTFKSKDNLPEKLTLWMKQVGLLSIHISPSLLKDRQNDDSIEKALMHIEHIWRALDKNLKGTRWSLSNYDSSRAFRDIANIGANLTFLVSKHAVGGELYQVSLEAASNIQKPKIISDINLNDVIAASAAGTGTIRYGLTYDEVTEFMAELFGMDTDITSIKVDEKAFTVPNALVTYFIRNNAPEFANEAFDTLYKQADPAIRNLADERRLTVKLEDSIIEISATPKTIHELLDDLADVDIEYGNLLADRVTSEERLAKDAPEIERIETDIEAKKLEKDAAEEALKHAVDLVASGSILIIDKEMKSDWLKDKFFNPFVIHGSRVYSRQEIDSMKVTILPSATDEIRKQHDLVIERQANGNYVLIGADIEISLGKEAMIDDLKKNMEKQIDLLLSV